LVLLAALVPATLAPTRIAAADESQGSLFIVGGGLRYGNSEVWTRLVKLASIRAQKSKPAPKGEIITVAAAELKPRIAVFPTASGSPIDSGNRVVAALNNYGADAFLVPVALRNIDVDYQTAVNDAKLVESVKQADGVFFTGGEQRRIVAALYAANGKNTPLLDAVWAMYRSGGVVAGTSAGAAVMSRVMCRDAEQVLATLQNGVTMGKEIDRGFGFLDSSWFVDQHALIRGRFARALVIMKSQGLKYGVGVDENTALEVHAGGEATIVGYKGALVLDLSEAQSDVKVADFNLKNAKLTYLDRGDSINLKTLAVTPSREKQKGDKIDPKSPQFKPSESRPLFYNDILGNTTVCDLLASLMDNKRPEAIGLAFDGAALREQQASKGFEFRFYRDDKSLAWSTGAYGGDAYTVSNVRLDVRPVTINGPLYK
jgi:cyanophycinase